jgi:hypothetical protein
VGAPHPRDFIASLISTHTIGILSQEQGCYLPTVVARAIELADTVTVYSWTLSSKFGLNDQDSTSKDGARIEGRVLY